MSQSSLKKGKNQFSINFIDYVMYDIDYLKKTTPFHNIIKRLVKTERVELLENFKSNHREFYDECFVDDETFYGEFLEYQLGSQAENMKSMNYYNHTTTLKGFKYLFSFYFL
ncbi:hypothetical protein ACTFIW_002984 [Dictyostelium discoideum]